MDIQDFIVEATKRVSSEILKRNNFTMSYIGRVKKMDKEIGTATVVINEADVSCTLPTNMNRFVTVGDIVVVQDLHNNKSYMIIHGVIKGSGAGLGEENTVIHVFDTQTNTVVSSVMQVWNESSGSVVSTTFDITKGSVM